MRAVRIAHIGPLRTLYRWFAVRGDVTLGRGVHIGLGTHVESLGGLRIGSDVYIGKTCTIMVDGSIGDSCLIGNSVGLVGRHDHDFRCVGVTVRRAPWVGDPDVPDDPGRRLVVEDDVWIGFGSVVLSGVRVGRGSVVAAGSVVTRDVEPYSIVAGNPASRVGERFTPADARRHENALYGGIRTPELLETGSG